MNRFNCIGRLTKDVELRVSQSNVAVASGSIAVRRDFKDKNGEYSSDFINFVAFKKTGELLSQYVNKGDQVGLSGRIQSRSYENNEGRTVYVTELVVDSITMIGAGKSQEETRGTAKPVNKQNPIDISDEDLPFDLGA